jgi:hypothetical protein
VSAAAALVLAPGAAGARVVAAHLPGTLAAPPPATGKRAYPAEITVLRQSIVEVAAIADDLERYATEHERRILAKEGEQPTDEGENPSSTD